jgi:hypothetical protein
LSFLFDVGANAGDGCCLDLETCALAARGGESDDACFGAGGGAGVRACLTVDGFARGAADFFGFTVFGLAAFGLAVASAVATGGD